MSELYAGCSGCAALSHRLKQRDDRGHGYVEGVRLTGHRNAHPRIRLAQPKITQSILLTAHHDGQWSAQIGVGMQFRRGRSRRHRADSMHPQPFPHLGAVRHDDRHGKEHSGRGPDDIGIKQVGHWVADDQGIHSGGIRTAQDGAEIARFLDRLHHQQKGGWSR